MRTPSFMRSDPDPVTVTLNHTVSTGNARGRFQFNHVPLTVPEAQGIYVKAHAPRYRHRSGGIHAAGEQHHRLFL